MRGFLIILAVIFIVIGLASSASANTGGEVFINMAPGVWYVIGAALGVIRILAGSKEEAQRKYNQLNGKE